MRDIPVERRPYGGRAIFGKNVITLKPGVTVLTGCNGYGKSTFLDYIEKALRTEGIRYIKYDNLTDGGNNSISAAIFRNSCALAGQMMCSSEGERILINMSQLASKIGAYTRECAHEDELWILLDATDSGLSIDRVQELKSDLFGVILEMNPDKDVYIVVSANEYELCADEDCLNIRNGAYRRFRNYEAFRRYIIQTRCKIDKPYAATHTRPYHRHNAAETPDAAPVDAVGTLKPGVRPLILYTAGVVSVDPVTGTSKIVNEVTSRSEAKARKAYGEDNRDILCRTTVCGAERHMERWNNESNEWESWNQEAV